MFRVHNLSPGRVQIRASGRSTPGGGSEIVDSISVKLIRLSRLDPPLVRWERVGDDLSAKPADAPPTAPPVLPVAVETVVEPEPVVEEPVTEPAPEPKSEVLAIAGDGIKEVLPVTEVVEEKKGKGKKERVEKPPKAKATPASFDDTEFGVGEDPEPAPPASEPEVVVDEPAAEPEPVDPRIKEEIARLNDADWSDIKAEAKDKGVSGRSRANIVKGLVELFTDSLK